MHFLLALLLTTLTPLGIANVGSEPSLSVQQKEGYLIFRIQDAGGNLHDAVIKSNSGSDLGATPIAFNLWRAKWASSGTFSAVLCTDTNCFLMDFDWETDWEPPVKHSWFVATLVIGILAIGVLVSLLWLIALIKTYE